MGIFVHILSGSEKKAFIIYGTNYGTTEKYAKELERRTGMPAVSYEYVTIPAICKSE